MTYRGFVGNSDVTEAFSASCWISWAGQLQQTLVLHGLDVGASRVPRSNLDLIVHLELQLLVISVFLRRQQELLAVASVL
jgi:hypothetical protein